MKRRVVSADLVRYNANDRGKNVGDCVKRSLSLATGTSYAQISKELMQKLRKLCRGNMLEEMKDFGADPLFTVK